MFSNILGKQWAVIFMLSYKHLLYLQRDDYNPSVWWHASGDAEEYEVLSCVKNCIGIIDGTHIPTVVLTNKAVLHRSKRKNECRQNIMTVCSFDMYFTWLWLGWEGFAHGWRFIETTSRQMLTFLSYNKVCNCILFYCVYNIVIVYRYDQFLTSELDKYCVVDVDYPNTQDILSHAEVADIIYKIRGVGLVRLGQRRYSTCALLVLKHYRMMFWCSEGLFPIVKRKTPYTLQKSPHYYCYSYIA